MADKPEKRPVDGDEQKPQEEFTPAVIEHPRRLRPVRRSYADKALRPDRVRGGFDTK